TKDFTSEIINTFDSASKIEKPGVAWALSIAENLNLNELLPTLKDLDSKHWIAYIIGKQGSQKHLSEIENLKNQDSEVYFAVTVLWKIMTSWVYNLKEY